MYKQNNIGKNNKEEVNNINNNKYNIHNINMEILSSIKSMPSKTILLDDNNNLFHTKDTNTINMIKSPLDIEPNISPNNTCSTSMSRDSILNKNIENNNYLVPPPHSIFKPMIHSSHLFNSFNYLPNLSQPLPVFLNPYNSFRPNYCFFCGNKYNYNLPPLFYNNDQLIPGDNNSLDKYHFLNKKRVADDNTLLNNEQKDVLDISTQKNRLLKKNNNNEKIQEIPKKIEKYFCQHNGCGIDVKTKKLATFHHFKMSPECHDDSISILKLINETKKILLKINKDKNLDINRISSLYDNTMNDLSFVECIKMYTGFKFKDSL